MALRQLNALGVHNLCTTWVPGDLHTLALMIPSKYNFNYKSEPSLFEEKDDVNNKMFTFYYKFDEIIQSLNSRISHTEHIIRYADKSTYTDLYNSSERLFKDILDFRNDLWKLCDEFKNIELFRVSPLSPRDKLFEERSFEDKQKIMNSLINNHAKKMNDFMELCRKTYNKFEEDLQNIIKFPKENDIKRDIYGKCLENEGFSKCMKHKVDILKELRSELNICKESYIDLLKNDKHIEYDSNDINITSHPTKFKFNDQQMSIEIANLIKARELA